MPHTHSVTLALEVPQIGPTHLLLGTNNQLTSKEMYCDVDFASFCTDRNGLLGLVIF